MGTEKDRWNEIESVVAEHKDKLKAATAHTDLREFAVEQHWDNRGDFGKYKFILKKFGINYDELRSAAGEQFREQMEDKQKQLQRDAEEFPRVRLWTAAVEDEASGDGSFAIVGEEGEAVWYGKFFDDDRVRQAGDLFSAEQSAAGKAVFLAEKAKEASGVDALALEIITTCPELNATALGITAAAKNIAVEITVDDSDNRAVEMAEMPGFRKWQDADLSDLVVAPESEPAGEDTAESEEE